MESKNDPRRMIIEKEAVAKPGRFFMNLPFYLPGFGGFAPGYRKVCPDSFTTRSRKEWCPSRAWAENDVPKLELGNEGKRGRKFG
jgi:hypothetical protein